MEENYEVKCEVQDEIMNDSQTEVQEKKTFFERKAGLFGNIITLVAVCLLMVQVVVSAISVFGEMSDIEGYIGFLIGYIGAAVLMLLPGLMLAGMVRKGAVGYVKALWSVILSVLFLLSIAVVFGISASYELNAAVLAMVCIIYFADLYVAACVVIRPTKLFGKKAKNILTVIGCVATVALVAVLTVSIVRMVVEAITSFTAVFLADTVFAVVCYFSFVMFIFSGMLTLHVKDK